MTGLQPYSWYIFKLKVYFDPVVILMNTKDDFLSWFLIPLFLNKFSWFLIPLFLKQVLKDKTGSIYDLQ